MILPEELGLRPGWTYEVIASTRGEDGPHAAPLGILTPGGDALKAELYKGSATLANILANGILGINLPPDASMVHEALYRREAIRFADSPFGASFVEGAAVWIAARLTGSQETDKSFRIEAVATDCRIFRHVPPLNRAQGLLLESLVLSTRRHLLPPDQLRDQLLENARVIAKVAPGSSFQTDVEHLLRVLRLPPRVTR